MVSWPGAVCTGIRMRHVAAKFGALACPLPDARRPREARGTVWGTRVYAPAPGGWHRPCSLARCAPVLRRHALWGGSIGRQSGAARTSAVRMASGPCATVRGNTATQNGTQHGDRCVLDVDRRPWQMCGVCGQEHTPRHLCTKAPARWWRGTRHRTVCRHVGPRTRHDVLPKFSFVKVLFLVPRGTMRPRGTSRWVASPPHTQHVGSCSAPRRCVGPRHPELSLTGTCVSRLSARERLQENRRPIGPWRVRIGTAHTTLCPKAGGGRRGACRMPAPAKAGGARAARFGEFPRPHKANCPKAPGRVPISPWSMRIGTALTMPCPKAGAATRWVRGPPSCHGAGWVACQSAPGARFLRGQVLLSQGVVWRKATVLQCQKSYSKMQEMPCSFPNTLFITRLRSSSLWAG